MGNLHQEILEMIDICNPLYLEKQAEDEYYAELYELEQAMAYTTDGAVIEAINRWLVKKDSPFELRLKA